MPKSGDLIRQIRRAGCTLVRHGKKHDIWENPSTGGKAAVPRHNCDVPTGTYHSILRDLGLE